MDKNTWAKNFPRTPFSSLEFLCAAIFKASKLSMKISPLFVRRARGKPQANLVLAAFVALQFSRQTLHRALTLALEWRQASKVHACPAATCVRAKPATRCRAPVLSLAECFFLRGSVAAGGRKQFDNEIAPVRAPTSCLDCFQFSSQYHLLICIV